MGNSKSTKSEASSLSSAPAYPHPYHKNKPKRSKYAQSTESYIPKSTISKPNLPTSSDKYTPYKPDKFNTKPSKSKVKKTKINKHLFAKKAFNPKNFDQDVLLYLVYGYIRLCEIELRKLNSIYKIIPDDIIALIKNFADFLLIPCKFLENNRYTEGFRFMYKDAKIRTAVGKGKVLLDGVTRKEEENLWTIRFLDCAYKDITIEILNANNKYLMGKNITANEYKIRDLQRMNEFTIQVSLDRRDEFKRRIFRDDKDELDDNGKRIGVRFAAWDRLTVKFMDIDYELENMRRQELCGDALKLRIISNGDCKIQAWVRKSTCSIAEWKSMTD